MDRIQARFVHARRTLHRGIGGSTGLRGCSQPWSVAGLSSNTRYEASAIRALCEATYYAGLHKDGMPQKQMLGFASKFLNFGQAPACRADDKAERPATALRR